MLGVALAPLAVLAARAPAQHWLPVGDVAVIGLRTGAVGTIHSPLVGPYSRFGWSHPGPLLFEILAVPYRLSGLSSNGLLIGALLVNAVALVTIVVRLNRFGGAALASLGVAVFGIATWSLGASYLWYPWNPNTAVLPFAALLVLAMTTARNSRWDVPLLAGFASFIAQTHVAYVPIVIVLVVAALVGRTRRVAPARSAAAPTGDAGDRAPWLTTGIVLLIAWTPPLLDAVLHGGGNLFDLVRYWFASHQTVGLPTAMRIMGWELSVRGPWSGFRTPIFLGAVAPHGYPIPVTLIALLGAYGVARHRQDAIARRTCSLVLVAIAVGTWSISRIVGLPLPYLLLWCNVLAAAAWLAVGWTLIRAFPPRRRTAERVVTSTLVAAALVVTTVLTVSALTAGIGPHGEHQSSSQLLRVTARTSSALAPNVKSVRVTAPPSFYASTFQSGLMLYLAQHGYRVTGDPVDHLRFGSFFANSGATDAHLIVTAGSRQFEDEEATGTLLAESSPPVPFPPSAPRPRPAEEPHHYLDRVRDRVSAATFRELTANLTAPFPIAVFETGRPR